MVFSSVVFLFFFFPVFFFIYYIAPQKYRNYICLFASLFFYAWGEPYYVLIMVGSIVINYWLGRFLSFDRSASQRKAVLVLAVVFNLSLLFVFKYLSFFLQSIFQFIGVNASVPTIALPLGISFYTFQAMSYIFDVYRHTVNVQSKLSNLMLYISLFPQLVAGPIVRYRTINQEIESRSVSLEDIADGIFRFTIGIGKKVLLANQLGLLADSVWQKITLGLELSSVSSWIGIFAYTLQIYFDFSGYSDMAIGMGRMMGFHFSENFNYPYISSSVSEFWRRWHISLGSWFRDYIYIPLGGNRTSKWKMLRNLLVVWGLTGLWHGANWTFILWGVYYGVLVCIEKFLRTDALPIPKVLRHLGTLLLVMLGWVLFRSDSIGDALLFLEHLVCLNGCAFLDSNAYLLLHDSCLLFSLAFIGSTPLPKRFASSVITRFPESAQDLAKGIFVLVLLVLCTIHLVNSTYNPFIYFRF